MTSALLKSCRTKNKLYRSFIKHPASQNKNAFIIYKNGFSKLRMAAKKLITFSLNINVVCIKHGI